MKRRFLCHTRTIVPCAQRAARFSHASLPVRQILASPSRCTEYVLSLAPRFARRLQSIALGIEDLRATIAGVGDVTGGSLSLSPRALSGALSVFGSGASTWRPEDNALLEASGCATARSRVGGYPPGDDVAILRSKSLPLSLHDDSAAEGAARSEPAPRYTPRDTCAAIADELTRRTVLRATPLVFADTAIGWGFGEVNLDDVASARASSLGTSSNAARLELYLRRDCEAHTQMLETLQIMALATAAARHTIDRCVRDLCKARFHR